MLHLESAMKTKRFSLAKVLNVSAKNSLLDSITVDFSGGVASLDLDSVASKLPTDKTFVLNSNPNGHHDARFCAWRGAEPIVVCVQMRHGVEKTEDALKPQLRTGPDVSSPLVAALLSIGSGPSSHATFKDAKFHKRAVRIDGSRFSSPSIMGLLDPAFIVSEEKRRKGSKGKVQQVATSMLHHKSGGRLIGHRQAN